jgi:glycosyltransferase involved in cell wall biosynthesis
MKILYGSWWAIVEPTCGAAAATLAMLQGLATLGFRCEAFCACDLGFPEEFDAPGVQLTRGSVLISIVHHELKWDIGQDDDAAEIGRTLRLFEEAIAADPPDLLIVCTGDGVTRDMATIAGLHGIPVIFDVHNFPRYETEIWSRAHRCLVHSEFAGDRLRERLGLQTVSVPCAVDWARVAVDDREATFVTFVNPQIEKGAMAFFGIARELGRCRPDIPLLVVETRGTTKTLGDAGVRPSSYPNVTFMPDTDDPREIYRRTKILLVPSLVWETTGLVAVEAMINGIPVIGSDRGALPETLGNGGIILPVPQRDLSLPSAEEVKPWVDNIIRLWDDEPFYREQSDKARAEAQRWHPDRVLSMYAEFFAGLLNQSRQPPELLRANDLQ